MGASAERDEGEAVPHSRLLRRKAIGIISIRFHPNLRQEVGKHRIHSGHGASGY
jgi:hypothetical protein